MPQYTVTKRDTTQSGRNRVYFDNKHGSTDGYLVSDKIAAAPQVGQVIEADTNSWVYQNKTFWGLNKWEPVKQNGTAPQQAVRIELPVAAPSGFDFPGMNAAQLVSNILATAIGRGLIGKPSDIGAWANAAQRALRSLRDGVLEPIQETGEITPDPSVPQGFEDLEDGSVYGPVDDGPVPF